MRALFDRDREAFADDEDIIAFRTGVATIGDDHRQVLSVLIPRLVALQERGDTGGALRLIAAIKRIVQGGAVRMN